MGRSRRSATAGCLTPDTRVTLRPPADGDAAMTYEIVCRADDAVIGEVSCSADDPAAGWLSVGSIAVDAGQRGWGYGSEAVRLLEAAGSAERFLARVDAGNGLGLYFWLRLGYRPARAGEVPGKASRGIITMVRVRTQDREPRT